MNKISAPYEDIKSDLCGFEQVGEKKEGREKKEEGEKKQGERKKGQSKDQPQSIKNLAEGFWNSQFVSNTRYRIWLIY